MNNNLNILKRVLALCLLSVMTYCCYQIVWQSQVQQVVKYDNANINHMRNGLFNVNRWKQRLTEIVVSEIEDFKLTDANKELVKSHIQDQLGALIDKVESQIKQSNEGSVKGWLKQKFMDTFVDVRDIKKGIPDYAETITDQISKEKTQTDLKAALKSRLQVYLSETYDTKDSKDIADILQRYNAQNEDEARESIQEKLKLGEESLFNLAWLIIALSFTLFALFYWGPKPQPLDFFLLLSALLMLLFVGVICPMIDMNAKIGKFAFVLLNHPIEFHNQTVYFQSKSILDVFWILISDSALQMKAVGLLMILFSIIFPITKTLCSVFLYFDKGHGKVRKTVEYFVLKSGKWSMTDVLIVAIMMAYIGFNGMLTTQFQTLKEYLAQIDMISTNETVLQIGFYVFLTYAILAMLFASMIARKPDPS
jgi:hypothetical protein